MYPEQEPKKYWYNFMTMLEQPLTLETFQVKLKNLRETPLSAAEQQAFARELDQLKAEIMAQLGEEDVRDVEMIEQIAHACDCVIDTADAADE